MRSKTHAQAPGGGAPAHEEAAAARPRQGPTGSDSAVVPLDRPRPQRRPVVPTWAWTSVLVLIAVTVGGVGVARWVAVRSEVEVPRVTGLSAGVARTRVERLGLELVVVQERFDQRPKGTVLAQSPAAGTRLKRGRAVEVVVSGGTEEFTLPDLIGDGRRLAEGVLRGRGLVVEIEHVSSEAPSDTVVGSVPSPGTLVRTGETVRLLVSAPRGSTATIRPYKLDGVSVLIDPAPAPRGAPDVTGEIALRLEAMLTASNAAVVVTRSALETATDEGSRAERAAEPTATVAIGLSLVAGSTPGRVVVAPPDVPSRRGDGSRPGLSEALMTELESVAPPVTRSVTTYDPVLSRTSGEWARVIIGSVGASQDAVLLRDEVWTDRVVRAIYEAIGSTYGEAMIR